MTEDKPKVAHARPPRPEGEGWESNPGPYGGWTRWEPFSPEETAAMGPPPVLTKEDLVRLARPNGEPPALDRSPESAKRIFINFVPIEWAPIQDAFARMIAVVGSDWVAERDLRRDLLSGQLIGAVRWCTFEDEWEAFEQLAPSVWEFVYVGAWSWPHDARIEIYPGPRQLKHHPGRLWRGHSLDFYIERAGLEKRYPLPGDMSATPATLAINSKPELPQRKRGPATKYDWHTVDAKIVRYCFGKDGKLAVPDNESRIVDAVLAEYAEAEVEVHLSETDVRAAVKRVCAELRKGPKSSGGLGSRGRTPTNTDKPRKTI